MILLILYDSTLQLVVSHVRCTVALDLDLDLDLDLELELELVLLIIQPRVVIGER